MADVLCSNSKWRLVPEFQRKNVIIISLLLLNLMCLSGFTRHLIEGIIIGFCQYSKLSLRQSAYASDWRNDEYITLNNFGGRMISDLEVKSLRAPSPLVAQ